MNNVRSMMDKINELRQQRAALLLVCLGLFFVIIAMSIRNETPKLRAELSMQRDLIKMKDEAFLKLVCKIRGEGGSRQ